MSIPHPMTESDFPPLRNPESAVGEDRMGDAVALISRMAKGDAAALAEIHGMWAPVLLGSALRILGDHHEAEEVVQDTFVRIWHRSADYDVLQSPPFAWAFAVLRGYCIDRLRYRHRSKRDSARVVPLHLYALSEETEDPNVMAKDDWRRVRSALDLLDENERKCLELAVFLEYTQSEISARLGTPLGTVKHRLRRALVKVRQHLSRNEF
jgi:RNA polymerase sigma-70 factor (ECF subfamily)